MWLSLSCLQEWFGCCGTANCQRSEFEFCVMQDDVSRHREAIQKLEIVSIKKLQILSSTNAFFLSRPVENYPKPMS
jgi:hypothetical protein